jgi:Cu-Zn family superoxide dismutase
MRIHSADDAMKETSMLRSLTVLASAIALAATGCSVIKSKSKPIQAVLAPTMGNNAAGTLTLTRATGGVRLQGRITGLLPGSTHGFHIHERGDCSASDASSAGGHFNPTHTDHGDPAAMVHHSGDIPNQVADLQGAMDVDVVVHGVSLDTGAGDDVLGRALIVHRDADDYRTQPSGNSGPRVACGAIIKPASD